MTVTCPVCKKKFHKGKSNEFGRLSRHLWREHGDYMRKRIKKGVRTKKTSIQQEMEYTDDMIIQSLIDAGIPLSLPRQQPFQTVQPQYIQPQYQYPVQHEQLAGIALAAAKWGLQYAVKKGVQAAAKKIKEKKKK